MSLRLFAESRGCRVWLSGARNGLRKWRRMIEAGGVRCLERQGTNGGAEGRDDPNRTAGRELSRLQGQHVCYNIVSTVVIYSISCQPGQTQ